MSNLLIEDAYHTYMYVYYMALGPARENEIISTMDHPATNQPTNHHDPYIAKFMTFMSKHMPNHGRIYSINNANVFTLIHTYIPTYMVFSESHDLDNV